MKSAFFPGKWGDVEHGERRARGGMERQGVKLACFGGEMGGCRAWRAAGDTSRGDRALFWFEFCRCGRAMNPASRQAPGFALGWGNTTIVPCNSSGRLGSINLSGSRCSANTLLRASDLLDAARHITMPGTESVSV